MFRFHSENQNRFSSYQFIIEFNSNMPIKIYKDLFNDKVHSTFTTQQKNFLSIVCIQFVFYTIIHNLNLVDELKLIQLYTYTYTSNSKIESLVQAQYIINKQELVKHLIMVLLNLKPDISQNRLFIIALCDILIS